MNEATYTFRVDETVKDAFTTGAKAHDRTGAQQPRDFMRGVVSRQQEAAGYDAWFRREVESGVAEVNAGDLVSAAEAAEVEAEAAAWRAETLHKLKKHVA